MTVPDSLMCKVLADINVLVTLTATNDVVAPFDTRSVVLKDGRWAILSLDAPGPDVPPRIRSGSSCASSLSESGSKRASSVTTS